MVRSSPPLASVAVSFFGVPDSSAAGVREILECFFEGRPMREEYLIVDGGKLAGAGAHAYSEGNVTGGSDEAAKFKK